MAAARLAAAEEQLAELRAGTRKEQIAAQRARVAQLEAAIDRIDIDLAKSELRAPFDGAVARRRVDEGTVVSAGTPIVEVIEDGVLEARVGIPVEATEGIQLGRQYELAVGNRAIHATVTALLPQLDSRTRTVTVVLTVAQKDIAGLTPGRIVRLSQPETLSTPGYWLPLGALAKGERGLWSAYALLPTQRDNEYTVERRDVEVLYTEAERAYVRGVLSPGELVVADGVHRIVPGQRVRSSE